MALRTWHSSPANFFPSKNGRQEWALSVTGASFYDTTAGALVAFTLPQCEALSGGSDRRGGYCLS